MGRVAPMTGSLASFGKGSLDVEEYAIESINADGGIYLEEYGKKLPVRFVMVDSESDTTKASEGATKLLNESGIDVMITSHTADTVNPVSAACERAGIPCISVDTPADAWAANGPYPTPITQASTPRTSCPALRMPGMPLTPTKQWAFWLPMTPRVSRCPAPSLSLPRAAAIPWWIPAGLPFRHFRLYQHYQ